MSRIWIGLLWTVALLIASATTSAPTLAADEDAVTYRTNITHTAQNTMPDFTLPVSVQWDVTFSTDPTYAVISGGTVYVVTGTYEQTMSLTALSAANGSVVWGPVALPLTGCAGLACDNGSVFVAGISTGFTIPALMVGVNGSTGAIEWSTEMAGQWDDTGAPTPYDGYVYAQSSGNYNCVRESDGTLMWSTAQYETEDGAMAVTPDALYVSGAGGDSYSVNPSNGDLLWSLQTGEEGGGGYTCAYYNGYVFIRDYYTGTFPTVDAALNASTGVVEETYPATSAQAFDNDLMFAITSNNAISATNLSTWANAWTVNDAVNTPVTAPTIINGIVYVGTSTKFIEGYNENTGALEVTVPLNETPSATGDSGSDMNAGDGLLVIPAGTHLIAVGPTLSTVTPAPTFNPPAGTYDGTQTVTISCTAPNSTIYYTFGDQLPTTASQQYTGPVSVTGSETLNAIAVGDGLIQSPTAAAAYTIMTPAATPTFSPAAGDYTAGQMIAISDATPNATIYYTTDGSTPTTASTQYLGPFSLNSSATVIAVAIASGYGLSDTASAAYTITPIAAIPAFSPAAGTYTSAQNVTITDTTPNSSIYYTLDRTTPTTGSAHYTGPIAVDGSETINAIAVAPGYDQSTVATAVYTISSSRLIEIQNTSGFSGATVVVPITVAATGVENTIGGSLTFDPTALTYQSASAGLGALGATIDLNTAQAASGDLGFAIALAPGASFAAGTSQVLLVTFAVASGMAATSTTPIGWSNQPVPEEVVDDEANDLPANFASGSVTVVQPHEGDVLGHGSVDLADWVEVGRIVVGLTPQPTGMAYECADCAPRSTLGSGLPIDLADWVQTGLYAVGLDPLTPAGGPTAAAN